MIPVLNILWNPMMLDAQNLNENDFFMQLAKSLRDI